MTWRVEMYTETVDGEQRRVVEDEALKWLKDGKTALGVAELIGWLQSVNAGDAVPVDEPSAPEVGGHALRYRCSRRAIVIFALPPGRVLVLRFGLSASALPRVTDLAAATRRLARWEPDNDEATRE